MLQFLNTKVYTKGIVVYEEIIKAYSSYAPDVATPHMQDMSDVKISSISTESDDEL